MTARFLPLLLLVFLLGCEEDRIEVTIVPELDGSFSRTIRFYRVDPDKPGEILAPTEEVVAAARELYGEPAPAEDESVSFRGEFRDVPPDLGHAEWRNQGGYTVWNSRLGSLAVYRERRPGPTDYHSRHQRAMEGIDHLVTVAVRMLGDELREEQGLALLLEYLDEPFREDLKDVADLFLAGEGDGDRHVAFPPAGGFVDAAGGVDAGDSAVVLAASLLVERGHLSMKELLRLFTAAPASWILPRKIAERMGRDLDPELEKRLSFLSDAGEFEAALGRTLEALEISSEEHEKRLRGLADQFLSGFGSGPRVLYGLRPPAGATVLEASRADGTQLLWADRIDGRPVRSLFYVSFVVPKRDWQEEHFGEIVLDGDHLRRYVLWLDSLSEEDAAEWEAAMEKTKPGPELWKTIESIRVTGGESMERGAEILTEAREAGGR